MRRFISGKDVLLDTLHGCIETALAASMGQKSLAGLDYQKQESEKALLELSAMIGSEDLDAYDAQFRKIAEEIQQIEAKRTELQKECRDRGRLSARLESVADAVKQAPLELERYDDNLARRLIDTAMVLSQESICVIWKNGEMVDVGL